MEAMRLSMLEQEERDKKERADKDKAEREGNAAPMSSTQPIASTSTDAAPRAVDDLHDVAGTSALPPAIEPSSPPASPSRRGPPGVSLLTATAPASAAVSTPPHITAQAPSQGDTTSRLLRQQSMAPSVASTTTEASSVDLDPGYQRLEDSDDD